MSRPFALSSVALLLSLTLLAPGGASAAPRRHAVHPALTALAKLAQAGRLAPLQRRLDGGRTVPVVVTVETAREVDAVRALATRGARRALAPVRVAGAKSHLSLRLPAASLVGLDALPGFVAATIDAPIMPKLPLDVTAQKADVTPLRNLRSAQGLPLTGEGVTVCDIDSGVDVFHPLFFKPDGGAFDFVDRDGDGRLTPGMDQVDVGQGPHTVRAMNGEVRDYYGEPLFGTDNPAYDPDFDYLYVDGNENGRRDFGAAAGFTDADPSLGEMLFVSDDADGNGILTTTEKLVGLKTSKIKAFRTGDRTYLRGESLAEAPWEEFMQHGVGASSVLVGGQSGFRRLVGMAPDADLVVGNGYANNDFNEGWFALTEFCKEQGAKVVLHEVAPIAGYHLDGSTPVEELIDLQSDEGVSHINPAGNYGTAGKESSRTIAPQQSLDIPFELPSIGAGFVQMSLWIRDTSRPLSLRLSGPDIAPVDVPDDGSLVDLGPVTLFGAREDSSRGTSRYDFWIFAPGSLTPGAYNLEVTDGSPSPAGASIDLLAFVDDDASGWGAGVGFVEDVTEDHLIGWPGNADKGLAVAAFTGTGYEQGTPDTRAYYSGRGFRIDGVKNLWISAPADPIAGARYGDAELGYWIYGGTSGASPHVAGVAALIHEAFPGSTGDQVKEKIRAGAVADSHTGVVPNDDWGYGKLDAYRSIFGVAPTVSTAPAIGPDEITIAPGASVVALTITDPDSAASAIRVDVDRTYDGTYDETLAGSEIAVDYPAVGDYRIRIKAVDEAGARGDHVLLVHVSDAPPATGAGGATSTGSGAGGSAVDGDIDVAGGGGCNVATGGGNDAVWLVVGGLALAGARRRRRRG